MKPLIARCALSGTRPYRRSTIPINMHRNNRMMLLMASGLLLRRAQVIRERTGDGRTEINRACGSLRQRHSRRKLAGRRNGTTRDRSVFAVLHVEELETDQKKQDRAGYGDDRDLPSI